MNITEIGYDIFSNILNELMICDVLHLSGTCKYFNEILFKRYQYIRKFLEHWKQIKLQSISLKELLNDLRLNCFFKNDRYRISFLEESIGQLSDVYKESIRYINLNSPNNFWELYCMILLRINMTISLAVEYFDDVRRGNLGISVNSDIYDLILVRYIHQIRTMIKHINDPSLVIENEGGRLFWKKKFKNRYYITYKEFQAAVKDVLKCDEKESESALWACIKFMINFPKDDIITPFKFHLLLCHFGPLDDLANNILTYCVNTGGFVGYVNMYGARDILLNRSEDQFLIRFSRNEPTNLTITYNLNYHTRKPHKISLKRFLEDRDFKKPVPDKIALKELKKIVSVNEYASNHSHYIVS